MKPTYIQRLLTSVTVSGFLILLLFAGCDTKKSTALATGTWKGELLREDGIKIPFNFELIAEKDHPYQLDIRNGEESLLVDEVTQKDDSLFIVMPLFDSDFRLHIKNAQTLEGVWSKYYSDHTESMKFKAVQGDEARFTTHGQPTQNISGYWHTEFPNGELDFKAIGAFKQENELITGTFLTPVGDFRYLEGVVSNDTLKLSGFNGGHVSLWTAVITADSLHSGKLYSLNASPIAWESVKSTTDSLPADYATNTIPAGKLKADFRFKDMQTGQEISITDHPFKDKVVIVDLLGSWCPNCYDETSFLIDYYNKNHSRGIEVIGLDFERTADFDQSLKAMQDSFFKRFDFPYPVLFPGVASTDRNLTEKIFPGLPQKIRAFPTLLFIDRSGYVRKVHSGFNGPATGKFYDEFKEEFIEIVNSLLAE